MATGRLAPGILSVLAERGFHTDSCHEVLLRFKEQRNNVHETSKRKANWIGHILHRNCLLEQVIEGKIKGGIEVTGRRGKYVRSYWMTLRKRDDTLI